MPSFREQMRVLAEQRFREQGKIDPDKDAKALASLVRTEGMLLAAYLDDTLEPAIRSQLRQQFKPTLSRPNVGSEVVSRDAIRTHVQERAKQNTVIPVPSVPARLTIPDLMKMSRIEVQNLAQEYAHRGLRDITVARWLQRIAIVMEEYDATVGDRFTRESLETLFEEAKHDQHTISYGKATGRISG